MHTKSQLADVISYDSPTNVTIIHAPGPPFWRLHPFNPILNPQHKFEQSEEF